MSVENFTFEVSPSKKNCLWEPTDRTNPLGKCCAGKPTYEYTPTHCANCQTLAQHQSDVQQGLIHPGVDTEQEPPYQVIEGLCGCSA